ncbi:MAG: hypothetical protein A2260_02450 [Candidatus Komeilibacteria bacterium RIFOXYA2_FULL_45_9]|nr:MAG: hypothetical protein A2260_02450 [Candidatus Komeilibacteria bacterium RIFOXYA2_FULL_45_9]OGY96097.1 MAG: hypothetical protein A3J95_03310 [Candidatus Komeilibacteria bacterium RIFOXYC2_FULL_45_12]
MDVACGDDRISRALVKKGHQVFGVDNNPQALSAAYRHGLICRQADIESAMPVADGFFDVILVLDILEHLKDPKLLLARLVNKLKPDGQIIIAIPNHFDLRNRLRILRGQGIIHWAHRRFSDTRAWNYPHIRFFRQKELAELLAGVGLFINCRQYNFMAGGLIPRRLTPPFVRRALLKLWPDLLSGKFVILCSCQRPVAAKSIWLSQTPKEF